MVAPMLRLSYGVRSTYTRRECLPFMPRQDFWGHLNTLNARLIYFGIDMKNPCLYGMNGANSCYVSIWQTGRRLFPVHLPPGNLLVLPSMRYRSGWLTP